MKKLNIISAVLAAAVSAAGAFTGLYRDEAWAVWQMKGQDIVTIIAAAVLIIFSTGKSSRNHSVTAGLNAYLLYTYLFYALELRLNPLFHLYLAIVLLSLLSLIKSVSVMRTLGPAQVNRGSLIFAVIYLLFIALTLSVLWNLDVVSTITGKPFLDTPSGEPLTIVYVFDLTFVIPAIAYTVCLLLKKNPFGTVLAMTVLVKCVTMGAALVGMTLGAWAGGIETEIILAVFWFMLAAIGIIALAVLIRGTRCSE